MYRGLICARWTGYKDRIQDSVQDMVKDMLQDMYRGLYRIFTRYVTKYDIGTPWKHGEMGDGTGLKGWCDANR